MTLTPGFTNEEIIDAVEEYLSLRHGQKTGWLAGQRFSKDQLHRWRMAYLAGTIDRGLVPRHATGMTNFGAARIRELERELTQARREHAQQIDKLRSENAALQEGTVALGKAIGFLQNTLGVQEPSTTEPTDQAPQDSPSATS